MVDIAVIVTVLLGLVLLLAGAVLSKYGVALLGVLVGAGVGSLSVPVLAAAIGVDGIVPLAAGVVLGGFLGIAIAFFILKWAIAFLGFLVGSYFGTVSVAPTVADVSLPLEIAIGLAIGVTVAVIAMVFTRSTLVVITTVTGAMLASTLLTLADLRLAIDTMSADPLSFDFVDPLFLGLIALGLLVQFGLLQLSAVKGIFGRLPGARGVSNRSSGGRL